MKKTQKITYKVKFWNDNEKTFQTLYYPYLETALMVANKLCHQIHGKVFITDGTLNGTYVVEA